MSKLGIGVLINRLTGNERAVKTFTAALGKTISALNLSDNALLFAFDDGSRMRLTDDGQSCCENRYMRTDDDLSVFVGAVLLGADTRDAPDAPAEYGEHEVQFLVVDTSKGSFTVSNHNEHNGYYGGFSITCHAD